MRDIIIIIVIIVIIFTGDVLTRTYLSKTKDELSEKLEALKKNVIQAKESNNREEIKGEIKLIEEKWKETNKGWAIIVMHQELDNIEQSIIRAKSNIQDGELEDALQEIETALFFLNHVEGREQLNLKNIF